MRSLDDIHADILRLPEDDQLRLEFADACAATDPARSRYIRVHVNYEIQRHRGGTPESGGNIEQRLGASVAPFVEICMFNRGFVEGIRIDPKRFLEHGEKLFALEPILHVMFTPGWQPADPVTGRALKPAPFAMAELLASPLLRRLRSIQFSNSNTSLHFGPEEFQMLLDCEHLQNVLWLNVGLDTLTGPAFRDAGFCREVWPRLYAHAKFRKMLDISVGGNQGWPGEGYKEVESGRFDFDNVPIMKKVLVPMSSVGRELEQKYGYIPSLHAVNWNESASKNWINCDTRAFYGEIPQFPVGAPVTEEMYVPVAPRQDW